ILTFPVAYGLALQGLKQARLLTNLLPPEIRTERLIKAKKPWAAAAAAALLLAVGGMTYGISRLYSAFGGPAIEEIGEEKGAAKGPAKPGNPAGAANDPFSQALTAARSEIAAIDKDKKDFVKAKQDAEEEGKAVESIAVGQKEQMNWLELSKFLDEAIP